MGNNEVSSTSPSHVLGGIHSCGAQEEDTQYSGWKPVPRRDWTAIPLRSCDPPLPEYIALLKLYVDLASATDFRLAGIILLPIADTAFGPLSTQYPGAPSSSLSLPASWAFRDNHTLHQRSQ